MEREWGYYAGTEIDQKWWKRFTKDGFFIRGTGQHWFDESAFYFLRTLTRTPISIPFERMQSFKIGTWHAGRWVWGRPYVKIQWNHDGQELCSGFVLTKTVEEAQALIGELERRVAGPRTKLIMS